MRRIARKLTLRRAEIAASIVAVTLTLLVVGAAQATESNPVSAWLIAHGGLRAWALTAPLALAGIFCALRRLHERNQSGQR